MTGLCERLREQTAMLRAHRREPVARSLDAAVDRIEALEAALRDIGGLAICYGMAADENELRDWLKFISETTERALLSDSPPQ